MIHPKGNPGSPMAVKNGCTCPIFDNNHGQGAYGKPTEFWMNASCPIHGLITIQKEPTHGTKEKH